MLKSTHSFNSLDCLCSTKVSERDTGDGPFEILITLSNETICRFKIIKTRSRRRLAKPVDVKFSVAKN